MNHLRVGLNVLEEELENGAAFCREQKLGIEVTAFAFPVGLDSNLEARIERHTAAVADVLWISSHGPFLDLYPTSPDPAVVKVARRRHASALEASQQVGAAVYVAHLNSIPLIRDKGYRDRFVSAAAEFWTTIADEAGKHGVTVVLENLWEPGPELQKQVIQEAHHPFLKASLDNGHALVFSERSAADWIEVLGDDLAHCHLHDNDRQYDHHWSIGEGTEDWDALVTALIQHAPKAHVILESDRLESNATSLERLRALLRSRREVEKA